MAFKIEEEINIQIPEISLLDAQHPNVDKAGDDLAHLEKTREDIAARYIEFDFEDADGFLDSAQSDSLAAIDSLLFVIVYAISLRSASSPAEKNEVVQMIAEHVENYNAHLSRYRDNTERALIEIQRFTQEF